MQAEISTNDPLKQIHTMNHALSSPPLATALPGGTHKHVRRDVPHISNTKGKGALSHNSRLLPDGTVHNGECGPGHAWTTQGAYSDCIHDDVIINRSSHHHAMPLPWLLGLSVSKPLRGAHNVHPIKHTC